MSQVPNCDSLIHKKQAKDFKTTDVVKRGDVLSQKRNTLKIILTIIISFTVLVVASFIGLLGFYIHNTFFYYEKLNLNQVKGAMIVKCDPKGLGVYIPKQNKLESLNKFFSGDQFNKSYEKIRYIDEDFTGLRDRYKVFEYDVNTRKKTLLCDLGENVDNIKLTPDQHSVSYIDEEINDQKYKEEHKNSTLLTIYNLDSHRYNVLELDFNISEYSWAKDSKTFLYDEYTEIKSNSKVSYKSHINSYNIITGKSKRILNEGSIPFYSKSNRYIAFMNDDCLTVWDTVDNKKYSYHGGEVFDGYMFSADENNIILEYSVYTIGSSMENKIKIWSFKDGKVVKLNSNVCLKVYKVLDCIPLRTDF